MDNLVEQVVHKKKNTMYFIKIVICILVAILIPATFFVLGFAIPQAYLIYIALFLVPFMIYGCWWFITSLKVDYEYALFSSTFSVAKIIAKRRRKNMLKVDVKSFSDMFKYDDKDMGQRSFTKVYSFGELDYSDENYVACFNSDARGKCALIFKPNEKMLNAMKPYLNHEIVKKVYYNK